ncbi:hypothetical protein AAAC51_07615 [Priestia megaterium]
MKTISFSASGSGSCLIKAADNSILKNFSISKTEVADLSFSVSISVAQNITLVFESNSELVIGKVQLENLANSTGYIPNDSTTAAAIRNNSQLIYPVKDSFPNQSGSIYVKITAPEGFEESATVTNKQMILRTDNNAVRLDYKNKYLIFFIGSKSLSLPVSLSQVGTAEIIISWNEVEMELTANGKTVSLGNAPLLTSSVSSLIFAEEGSIKDPIILEEWALFSNKVAATSNIQSILPQATIQSLFDGGISGQNVTWSEIPVAPIDHSPILVQKRMAIHYKKYPSLITTQENIVHGIKKLLCMMAALIL